MTDDQKFDIYYGHAYHALCQSFYGRVDFLSTFVQLVGGSAAAAGVVASAPWLVSVSGVILAVCAAISVAVQPAIKADRHLRAKCQFWAVKAEAEQGLDGSALQAKITQAQSDAPAGIMTLDLPAYNRALHMLGYDKGFQDLGPIQSLLSRISG